MRLCYSFSGVAAPSEVAPLRLLVVLVVVQGDLVGGWRVAVEADFVAAASSVVISAIISKRHLFVARVWVTLLAAASNSASTSVETSSEYYLLLTFSLPLQDKTGTGGSSSASLLFLSLMVCFRLFFGVWCLV